MSPDDPGLPQLTTDGGCATITLSRPHEHNRIDPADVSEMMRHLDRVQADPASRVLVLTGQGERSFSSGYTLGAIRAQRDNSLEQLIDRIEVLALPTLCALNGSVYGGACDLALACDFRIGVLGSRMYVPAARFGLHYYPGGIRRYVARLGPTVAKRILLTGMPMTDADMLRVGFLQDLVAPDLLASRVADYVAALTQCEAGVIASMKHHIDALAAGDRDDSFGRSAYETSLKSEELARRLGAIGH
jgi:enoyl-CoA hydratase/carnithine racemase